MIYLGDYKSLLVWKKAHSFTLAVYQITESFPKTEIYALTSQLQRASSSICANLAEGSGRNSKKEFVQFISISLGSAKECEYFLLLVKDLAYIDNSTYDALNVEIVSICKMLYALITSLKKESSASPSASEFDRKRVLQVLEKLPQPVQNMSSI